MISYQILSKHLPQRTSAPQLGRQLLNPADPEYKLNLFNRYKSTLQFKKGMRVRLHGSKQCGKVEHILYDMEDVIWVQGNPHFIEVRWDNGEFFSYTPRQLSLKRVLPKGKA